jgi:hypothetical protein
VNEATLRETLEAVGLPELAGRLDEAGHWALQLSPGEQQRIAFARALVQKPDWLFLDEASSALDEATEARLYRLVRERLAGTTIRAGLDWYAFTLAFKGVFLEGLEMAFIVLAFGTSQGSMPLAALGVGLALVLVQQPLSRVPENTMKFAVGLMLATFGSFWSGEGLGLAWPGGDAALLGIFAFPGLAGLGRRAAPAT